MKPKVLVVDDEAGMREFLGILLEKEGYETQLATSGIEAKEIFASEKLRRIFAEQFAVRMNNGKRYDGHNIALALMEMSYCRIPDRVK